MTTYYVCFQPIHGEGWPRWLRLLTRPFINPELGHVSLLWRCPDGMGWAYVESLLGGTDVFSIAPVVNINRILDGLRGNRRWVVLRVEGDADKSRFRLRGITTCVSLVKSIIGIRAWWVVTPEQLMLYLLGNGGEVVDVADVR